MLKYSFPLLNNMELFENLYCIQRGSNIDDTVALNNSRICYYVDGMCHADLVIYRVYITDSTRSDSYLDRDIEINNKGRLRTKR